MIRPTTREETPALVSMTEATAVFKPHEIVALQEVFDDYFAENHDLGHRCVTSERDGQLLGFAYYAPAAMTQGTWHLWWIVVRKDTQARGIGGELLHHVEAAIRNEKGRVLFIETGSQPIYDLTRRFYLKHHYEQEAVLRDFYSQGDSMVVFRKALS